MSRPNGAPNQQRPPDVRFSAEFLQQRRREDRRLRLLGVGGALATSAVLLFDSWRAYQQGHWVDIAARINQHVMVPPVIGALLGLLALAIGVYFLWTCLGHDKQGSA